jgi:hypothetical protein
MYYLTLFLFCASIFFRQKEKKALHNLILRIQEVIKSKPDSKTYLTQEVFESAVEEGEELLVISETGQVFRKEVIFSDPESCMLVLESDRMGNMKMISFYLAVICLAFSLPL